MTLSAQAQPSPDLSMFTPQAYKAREVHAAVEMRVVGDGAQRAYLFVPAQPRVEDAIPVVLFHHGWQGMNPMNFGALIDHLVRSGHAVIYPVYQDSEHTPPPLVTDNAGYANRQALNVLSQEFGLIPRPGQTLYYGFSVGSAISINLALNAEHYGLPPADAMMLVSPGDAYHADNGRWTQSIYGPVEMLPADLPVVIITGEDDDIGLPTARKLAARLCHIPREHRIMLVVPSSSYNGRKVMAGHGSPGAPDSRYNFSLQRYDFPRALQGLPEYEVSASLNQLDFYGYWKIADGLLDGLKSGSFAATVFGDGTDQQLSLGFWGDGMALNPMKIENPCP
ncbi:alpha/beta hydrolase [Saezia sanguinis]|nr:hypothetical protein [Saezia sanguinis]